MAKKNHSHGIDAVTQLYEQIANSSSMQAARDFMNSPAARAAQEFANSPAMKVAAQYANKPGYQVMERQMFAFRRVLDQVKPAYLDVPLYNAAVISSMNQTAGIAEEMQRTASMIQSILPDMSVLNSISETLAVLNPVFDSIQGAIDSMKPLWESGVIHSVNPDAVWSCMKNEVSLQEDLNGEEIDEKSFTNDVAELIQSDAPQVAMPKFNQKWKKVSKSAFGVITWITLTIASGKVQYEMQPLYQNTPHISTATEQSWEGISKNQVEFSVFCIENVAVKLGISGDEAYRLLTKDNDILDEYIIPNYEMLHTQDKGYIVSDIIDYMKECGVLK